MGTRAGLIGLPANALPVMPSTGSIDAPAKINLTLEILTRRPDGYHGVRTIMLPIALYDALHWEPAERFEFVSDGAPAGEENLVARAVRALGVDVPVRLTLEKRIPTGGGLGGGSSDAAAVLRAAARGAFGALGERDYLALAKSLGSDVPFFLVETGALVEGMGERVTALGALPPWWVVVLIPPVEISTIEAYAQLDERRGAAHASRTRNASASLAALVAVQRADFGAAAAAAMNDFEPVVAAREPLVGAALDALRESGARLVRLTGSGASCFALAETRAEAEGIAARLAVPGGARVHVVPLAPAEGWRG